jgi:hypothetical protein
MNSDNPIVQQKVTEILTFVNKLPIQTHEQRMILAKKMIDETFSTEQKDAYESDDEKKDDIDDVGIESLSPPEVLPLKRELTSA